MAIHPHHRITIGTKATVPITTVETIMATAAITAVIIANLA